MMWWKCNDNDNSNENVSDNYNDNDDDNLMMTKLMMPDINTKVQ